MGIESSNPLDMLFESARRGEWEKTKNLIDQCPELMWNYNPGVIYHHVFVSFLVTRCSDEEKIKELMGYIMMKAFSLTKSGEEYTQLLRIIFECEDPSGRPPIFYAFGKPNLFIHLVEKCCPSGVDCLERMDKDEMPLAYDMVLKNFDENSFEYLIENASNGIDILYHGGKDVFRTVRRYEKIAGVFPVKSSIDLFISYLISARAKSFLLRQEKKRLFKTMGYFPEDSLVNLVLSVMVQNTELIHYRECECI